MIEVLNFIFQDFWHYIGFIFLILIIGGSISNILSSFRLFHIKNENQIPQNQQNQNFFNDLIKIWNKNKNKD